MDNFGLSGLAQSGQYNERINDLRYNDEYERRVKAEAIARAKMTADEQKFQHATNPIDEAILREDAKAVFNKTGRLRQENPDWEWNPDIRAMIDNEHDSLKTHPALLRSLQYDQAMKEYKADLAEAQKNPQQWDTELMAQQGKQFDDYLKANPNDIRAGKVKVPLYTRPAALPDANQVFSIADHIQAKPKKVDENGGWMTVPEQKEVEAVKNSIYAGNQRWLQVMAKRNGFTTPEQLDNWITNGVTGRVKQEYHPGDPFKILNYNLRAAGLGLAREKLNLAKAKAQGGGPVRNTYDDLIDPKMTTPTITDEDFKNVWGRNQKMVLTRPNGQPIDLSDQPVYVYDPIVYKPKDGPLKNHPHAAVQTQPIPIELAEEKGLVRHKSYFSKDDEGDWEPADGFSRGQVEIKKMNYDKNNPDKTGIFVVAKNYLPLQLDNSVKMKFQQATNMPTKHRGLPDQPRQTAMKDEAGNYWSASGEFLGGPDDINEDNE